MLDQQKVARAVTLLSIIAVVLLAVLACVVWFRRPQSFRDGITQLCSFPDAPEFRARQAAFVIVWVDSHVTNPEVLHRWRGVQGEDPQRIASELDSMAHEAGMPTCSAATYFRQEPAASAKESARVRERWRRWGSRRDAGSSPTTAESDVTAIPLRLPASVDPTGSR